VITKLRYAGERQPYKSIHEKTTLTNIATAK